MIAITGANGLLGSFIVRKLIEQHKPFIAIKRKDSDVSLLHDAATSINWRTADILDPVGLEEAFQGATQVIHTAAMVSFNPRCEKKIFDINVNGTRNVVNVCLANNIQRLLHVSSVAALGRQKGQHVVTEESKWVENPLNSTYAKSKYLAELEVYRGQEEGLSTVILNPSVILAPADWNKSSAQLFKYVWQEKKLYIDSNLNYVDVRDVAEVAWQLLNSSHTAKRFIANAGTISFIDFFRMIASKFNKRPPDIKVNRSFLLFASALEGIRSRITGSEPLLTKETARLAGTHFSYDNTRIKNSLSFDFQPIEKTVEWCCEYYKLNFISKK